jgi:hypothetical protein
MAADVQSMIDGEIAFFKSARREALPVMRGAIPAYGLTTRQHESSADEKNRLETAVEEGGAVCMRQ